MIVHVTKTTTVQPAQETPNRRLWCSNLDLFIRRVHTTVVSYFRPNGSADFFDPERLKDSLSRVLTHYYPMAGRLATDQDGRIEIDCNAKGVLFVEAETTSVIDDLGDFAPPCKKSKLTPTIDKSAGMFSFPLFAVQVTYFKCGGVSLGTAMYHIVTDGLAATNFMEAWCAITRGLDISITPFIDRACLSARDPPHPKFHHIEYQPSPRVHKTNLTTTKPTTEEAFACSFVLTKCQVNNLKSKLDEEANQLGTGKFTTYEILASHIWSSVSKARGLANEQDTKLFIPTTGMFRLQPPLPSGYVGNTIFWTTPICSVGDLISKPLGFVANEIHKALKKMDNEYLRSALDYLTIEPEVSACIRDDDTYKCPNLKVNSWSSFSKRFDFGWGQSMYMGPGFMAHEGMCYLLRALKDDGSVRLFISLQNECVMKRFEKYLYDI